MGYSVVKQFIPLQSGSGALNKCIELFKQESKLLKELGKHPQIPDLFAFFEQESKLYLIQEFIDGQDLLKELQVKKRYSEAEVKEFLLSLLSVIEFIHGQNILHRDIKLENIIRRQDGVLMLIDFGISKQTTATIATQMGTIAGTPGYAAPEQMRGLVHPTSDLYSLAVTAVRMLTGSVPQEKNGSTIDELFDIFNMEWIWQPYLSKNGLSISKELAEILAKMLEDKVNKRFQSATEILQILNQNTQQISTPKPPQTTILSTPKPPQNIPIITQIQTPEKPKSNLKIDLGKGIILELVEIPAGSFLLGGQHKITFKYNFHMGKYPVTQAQYQAIMGSNPSYFGRGSASVPALENHPVESVSWDDAVKFCQRLSQKTGRKFRLPSESEWEYACRATPPTPPYQGGASGGVTPYQGGASGGYTKYWFGDNDNDLKKHAWYKDNSGETTHSVKEAEDTHSNPWGLVDMHGNVWEWCQDEWTSDVSELPTDGSAFHGDNDNRSDSMLRGGSWGFSSNYCTCANRDNFFLYKKFDNFGFRVVCV